MSNHVDLVLPSVHFDAKLRRRDTSNSAKVKIGVSGHGFNVSKTIDIIDDFFTDDLKSCNQVITPACLRALYGFYYEPQETEKNSYAIGLYTFRLKCLLLTAMHSRVHSTGVCGE